MNMDSFQKILHNIKKVKIQGATSIAKKGVEAFLHQPNKNSALHILNSRPTEPLLQNALLFLLNSENQRRDTKKFFSYLEKSNKAISIEGEKLIKDNMNIYSHCHSSTVISILKQAKKKNKNFIVYTSEVRPLLQGETTAKELVKAKINVVLVPDLAIEQALSKCDLFLFGADAYLPKGVVNKIGTSLICEIARKHNIPTYSCGVSLKFAKKIRIEMRSGKEVWDERSKFIKVENPAFDFTPSHLISGVVSEFGISKYPQFIEKAKLHLTKWK
jgi:translation initiation factor 2B subunit (eIF-2B alpha/beta/delta family)